VELHSQAFEHGLRTLAGVFVALLVSAVLAPSRTEAGCSHYVTSGNSHVRMPISQLDVLNSTGSPSIPTETQPPFPPRPCSGALCSGKPAVPAPVPAVSTETYGEQWGELLSPSAALDVQGRWLERAETLLQSILRGRPIDRPPRASDRSHP
jgi:hypothetical protein